ncbi:MAG: DUF378 domain-containing protein [Candidatus Nanohaloarchaea archaeon]
MADIDNLDWITLALVVIGALNWGLVGAVNFDLVATLFGEASMLSRLIYILVGLSGLYQVYFGYRLSEE